jgi:hypothetical protein
MALVETLQRTASSNGEMYRRSNASALFDLRGVLGSLSGIARLNPWGATWKLVPSIRGGLTTNKG